MSARTNAGLKLLLAGALAAGLAGCAETPLPAPSPGASYSGPVLREDKMTSILGDVEETLAAADAAKDAKKLEPRFAGDALAARTAAYTLATKSEGDRDPVALNFSPQLLVVDNAESFPRHAAFVSQVPEGQTSPVLATLGQQDARANYTLDHWVRLFPGVAVPEVPSPSEGTEFLSADDDSLASTPTDALAAYAAAINDADGKQAKALGADPMREAMAKTVAALDESLTDVGEASWKADDPAKDPIAFRTADGGAIVVGTIPTKLVLKKTVARSTLTVSEDLATFAGTDPVAKSITGDYQAMVALYVPGKDVSETAIKPLGAEQTLIGATREK